MSDNITIEARLARLEQDVAWLKQQAARRNTGTSATPDWIDRIAGSVKDYLA